jgi:cell filamentation protein
MPDDLTYPGTWTLKNKFGERNLEDAQRIERLFSTAAANRGIPEGNFDAEHVKRVHRHLFENVYEWAGQFRQTPLQRLSMQSLPQDDISAFAQPGDINGRLSKFSLFVQQESNQVRSKTDAAIFIAAAYADLNNIHPFREGNGRTAKALITKLCESLGYDLNLKDVQKTDWDRASKLGNSGHTQALQDIFFDSLQEISRDKDHERIIDSVTVKSAGKTTKVKSRQELLSTLSSVNGKATIEYVTDSGKSVKTGILAKEGIVYRLQNGKPSRILNIQAMPTITPWDRVKETLTPEKKSALITLQKTKTKQLERGPPERGR